MKENECTLVLKLGKGPFVEGPVYIGVDRGALVLAEQGRHMELAIGDFDSVSPEDLEKIRCFAREVLVLNPIKDDSDSEAAVRKAKLLGYKTIHVLGALGGRMDHCYVNLNLAMQFPDCVILEDEKNRIQALGKGVHTVDDSYSYVSFFAVDEAQISLMGFKYPLSHRILTSTDLYGLSNEVIKGEGCIEVEQGVVLMMQCKD